ncbi:MAG: fluoride efflux transporter FluC [Acidimicrobiales bacterium]
MPARRSLPGHRHPYAGHHDADLPVDPDLAPDDPGEPSRTHVRAAPVARWRRLDVLGAILAGGFLGALARDQAELAWVTAPGRFPWATFTVNTSGALFLGVVLTLLLKHPGRFRHGRPFLCVGFAGAWTTMSTLALQSDLLAKDAHLSTGLAYVAATVVVGIAAAWAGIVAGRRLSGERR